MQLRTSPGIKLLGDVFTIKVTLIIDTAYHIKLFPKSEQGHFNDPSFFATPVIERILSLLVVIIIHRLVCLYLFNISYVLFNLFVQTSCHYAVPQKGDLETIEYKETKDSTFFSFIILVLFRYEGMCAERKVNNVFSGGRLCERN